MRQDGMNSREVQVCEVASPDEAALVAALLRDFVRWCRNRYRIRPWQVETYFRAPDWERELVSLHQVYAPPTGALLLARVGDEAVGCVALRSLGDGVAEMKRLYVADAFRGLGIERRLVTALVKVAEARAIASIRLDTGDLQHEAEALYRSLGFREIEADYKCPPELLPHLKFMQLDLPRSPDRTPRPINSRIDAASIEYTAQF
jgi:putative acetyltransferase